MAEPLGASLPINPSGGIDHRLHQGLPVNAVTPHGDGSSGTAESPPSTEFHLGTTIEAVVRGPPASPSTAALPVGTHLLLRIVAMPQAPPPGFLIGRVIESGGPETLVDTLFGLLALQRKLGLPDGTLIAFERIEATPPALMAETPPSRAGGWPALDEALAVLAQTAPDLATQLRAALTPGSGAEMAGSLLFLLGMLYRGDWPGGGIAAALSRADHAKLAKRLGDDSTELRRLADDPATGEWRVLTLPLLAGMSLIPLRLFIRRGKPAAPPEEATRFAVEVEFPQFGPLQLDGLLRGTHLILVLRSHHELPAEIRDEASEACRRAMTAWGLSGDLGFATVAEFALTPLSKLRKHVQVSI